MNNNACLIIEQYKVKILQEDPTSVTPYKDAFFKFMKEHNMYDPEELLEIVGDILKDKIKQEFIDANNFNKKSEFAKQNNLSEFF